MKKKLEFALGLVSDKFKEGVDKAYTAWKKLEKKLGRTMKLMVKVSKVLNNLEKGTKKGSKGTEKFSLASEKLTKAQIKQYKQQIALAKAIKAGAVESEKITGKMRKYHASLKRTNEEKKKGVSLFRRLGKSMLVQVSAAIGLTTAITRLFSAFASGARRAREMERGFQEINTLYTGADGLTANTKKLIIEQSNLFGRDIQTNQKAFYDIVSSGITNQAEALKVLEASNKLAVGGLTETGTAADLLTSAMNSWGHETYTATQITDILFQTVRKGKTTINEMAGSLGQVFPIASKAGASLEEVGAAIATMTASGAKTTEAVTFLKNILKSIIKKEGPEASKIFKELLGYEWDQASLKVKGFKTMILDLLKATKGNADVLGKLIPDIRGLSGIMSVSANNGKTFAENMEAMMNATGATDEAVGKMANTMDQRLKRATQELINELNGLSEATGEAQVKVVEFGRDGVKWFKNFLVQAQEYTTELIGEFAKIKDEATNFKSVFKESFFGEDLEGKGIFERLIEGSKRYLSALKEISKEKEKQKEKSDKATFEAAERGIQVFEKIRFTNKLITEEFEGQTKALQKQSKVKEEVAKKDDEALTKQRKLIDKFKDDLGEGFNKIADTLYKKLAEASEKIRENLEKTITKIREQVDLMIEKIKEGFGGSAFKSLGAARKKLEDNPDALRKFNEFVSQVDIKTISPQAIANMAEAAKLFTELGYDGKESVRLIMNEVKQFKGFMSADDPLGIIQGIRDGLDSDEISRMLINLFKRSLGARQEEARQKGEEKILKAKEEAEKKIQALREKHHEKMQSLTDDLFEKLTKDREERKALQKIFGEDIGKFGKAAEKIKEVAEKGFELKVDDSGIVELVEKKMAKRTKNKTSNRAGFR